MEEKDFNKNIESIEFLKSQVTASFSEVKASINENTEKSVESLLNLYKLREKNFKEYLDLLREFNYSDNLLTATDMFPGIRTISDTVDLEELNSKSQKMKGLAEDINNESEQINSLQDIVITQLKKAISNLADLIIQESQINDMNMDLVKDLDSIYDIGYLKNPQNKINPPIQEGFFSAIKAFYSKKLVLFSFYNPLTGF